MYSMYVYSSVSMSMYVSSSDLPPKWKDKCRWNLNLVVWKSSYGVIIKI